MTTPQRQTSHDLFARARRCMPGGVNSPVRAFGSVGGEPVFYQSAEGSHVVDTDGNRYVDFIGSWGPMILGHRPSAVMDAVSAQLQRGTSFGAPCEAEVELAEKIVQLVPCAEKVRMVSSGTEATMSAIRLARGFTNRTLIVKFAGCYHGHSDALLADAGSGVATLGIPGTPGVTLGAVADTLIAPYNNLEALERLIDKRAGEVACIIVEPVAGNMGVVVPEEGFLQGLRDMCDRIGALLIFDEVITGFRVALGGAQQRFGILPDLCALGKIIGGGFPVGCLAGRAAIMDALAPVGSVYQAGTLSGNPVAMRAGLALLGCLERPGVYEQLEAKGERLETGLNRATQGYSCVVNRFGSLATLFFATKHPHNYDEARLAHTDVFARYFEGMLARGYLIAPSQFEALFLSLAHTDDEIDGFTKAVGEVLKELSGENVCIPCH